ncbi:MAG TPA: GMC family oxidoreductase, partial [Solirubrobacteraceae bacterium]
LRLAQKGYSVGVLECGRRFEDADFARSAWDVRRFYWLPRLGLRGTLRMSIFKDMAILSGAGVGGGSLVYSGVHYRPPSSFFSDPQWAGTEDWETALAPHYDEVERMLGVSDYEHETLADSLLLEIAEEDGYADSFRASRVAVFQGEPGRLVPDPYFGGEGPPRSGCVACGSCMIGCRHNAKNILTKNYLWLAERSGARIIPERLVVDIRPLEAADGSDGYAVTSERPGALPARSRRTHTARGVVVAAGPLGTNALLQRCRLDGSLPRISSRLGRHVRTNSESLLAVTASDERYDFSSSVAISSSVHPSADVHAQPVTYGTGGDGVGMLFTLLNERSGAARPLRFALTVLRHPVAAARMLNPWRWSRRTVMLLVMQAIDSSLTLKPSRRLPGGGVLLATAPDPDKPKPEPIPAAYDLARRLAGKIGGTAQASIFESGFGIPVSSHILGGAVIGRDREHGVIDSGGRVFGYERLLVCDGSAVPANLGVNPSLTIAALAEHAMSKVPAKRDQGAAAEAGSRAPTPDPVATE